MRGEVHADKKERYEQQVAGFKKLLENAEQYAELIGEKMPALPVDTSKRDDMMLNVDVYTPGVGDEVHFHTISIHRFDLSNR